MDEVVVRRVVGILTLAIIAFLLSWLLPRPGLDRLRGANERVVTMDLTRPDSRPEEVLSSPEEGAAVADAAAVESSEADQGEPQAVPPAPGQTAHGSPIAPAPVPPVVAQDAAPPPLAPDPVEVIALPEPEPKPKPEPKPVAKPEPKSAPNPEPKSAPKPVPKPPAPVVAKPAPPAKPVVSASAGKVVVQAGAYSLIEKAETIRGQASARGVNCFISPAETAKGTLYRLRCGPFPDRAKADAAVKALSAGGIAAQVVSGG
jgi:DedD protein